MFDWAVLDERLAEWRKHGLRIGFLISSSGVSSSKTTTRSTASSAAITSARPSAGLIGRPLPFSRLVEASLLSPTTREIAGGAGLGQQFDMAAVQEIEAAARAALGTGQGCRL